MIDTKYKKLIRVDRIISLDDLCGTVNALLEKENRPANITLTRNNFKHYFKVYKEYIYKDLQKRLPDYQIYLRIFIGELLPK